MTGHYAQLLALLVSAIALACSRDSGPDDSGAGGSDVPPTGGQSSGGGESSGSSPTGGAASTDPSGGSKSGSGGISADGGSASSGTGGSGGTSASDGGSSSGGDTTADGGEALGGTSGNATGGLAETGGDQAMGGSAGAPTATCKDFGEPSVVGEIESDALGELSGLAASRAQPGVLYAHADSGAGAVFYAMSTSGATLGQYTLVGASATDWEDIAVGPGSQLYIADTGDNAARTGGAGRSSVSVFRLPEPTVSLDQAPTTDTLGDWEKLEFTYPDAAHDCETLMVDPISGDLIFITKEDNGASVVFRAPGAATPETATQLEEIARLQLEPSGTGAHATAGDFSPTGDRIMLRSYVAIRLWTRPPRVDLGTVFSGSPVLLPQPTEPQSEGLTFSADGLAWFAAGERESAIYSAVATCN